MVPSSETPGDAVADSDALVEEGLRLATSAAKSGIALKLTGSAAIRVLRPQAVPVLEALGRRALRDLDFFALNSQAKRVESLFAAHGYEMDPSVKHSQEFGIKRHIYVDAHQRYKVDVFLDDLVMAHTVHMKDRLDLPGPTISVADLLLSKLQIHEITRNDLLDTIALLAGPDGIGESTDEPTTARLLGIFRDDWGFWYTATRNLDAVERELTECWQVLGSSADLVAVRLRSLQGLLNEVPKSLKWKMRGRVGARTRWYEEVSEVDRET